MVRLSVQIDNTAVIFCCGSNILRLRWVVFIFYILSRIVDKFFLGAVILAIDKHFHLALFSPDHHRLATHTAHHVKRIHRSAPKGQFKGVFLNPLFQRVFQLMGDLKEPVSRTQPADTLMRSLIVVVLHPESGSFDSLLEVIELGSKKELALDAFPETLDLTQCHGVVGARSDVFDPVFFHLPLKPGFPPPVGVLPAVVGEHLPGNAVFSNPAAVSLQNVFGGLAAVKPQAGDVA